MTTTACTHRISAARRRRNIATFAVVTALAVTLLGLVLARALLGEYPISLPDAVRILTGTTIPGASFVLLESTLPRAVLGALAGIAFGLAGSLSQTVLRNPLASPDVLGIDLGASAAAIVALVVFGANPTGVTAAALAGALAVAVTIVAFGKPPHLDTTAMILAGVACSMLLGAIIHWVIVTSSMYQAREATGWLTGSVNAVPWTHIGVLAAVHAAAIPVALWVHYRATIATSGDDLATAWGISPARTKIAALIAVVVLCATTTAVTGPIAFVALLAGPIARWLRRGAPAPICAALVGGCLVVAADYTGAYAIDGVNLPVGVITGTLGAPVLLVLVLLGRKQWS